MSNNNQGMNWIIYIMLFVPMLLIQRSCMGANNPKFNCQESGTYCYSWKGTDKVAAVVSKQGNNVEIKTPIGTGQGRWTRPGDANAKVFFQTKEVNCYGLSSASIILGYSARIGFCTD